MVVILLIVLVQEFPVIPNETYRGSSFGRDEDQIQTQLPRGKKRILEAFSSKRGFIGAKQKNLLCLDGAVDEVGVMPIELHFLGLVILAKGRKEVLRKRERLLSKHPILLPKLLTSETTFV